MDFSKFFIIVLVLFVAAGNASSQALRSNQIEVYGGIALPMAPEEFKDYYKMGYSFHGQYVIFPSSRLGISFGVGYEPFSVDEDALIEDASGYSKDDLEAMGIDFELDMSLSVLELCAGVRPYLTVPEANTQIFLFGTGTYNLMKAKADLSMSYYDESIGEYVTYSYEDSADENKFGLAAGAGIEVPMGAMMNLIFQGLYRFIFTEDETTSFLGITMGVVF